MPRRFTDRTEDGHFFKWDDDKRRWGIMTGEGERLFVIPPSESEKTWKLRILGEHSHELRFEEDDAEIRCFAFAAGFATAEDPDEDDDFDDPEDDDEDLEDDWDTGIPSGDVKGKEPMEAGDGDLEDDLNVDPDGPKIEPLPNEDLGEPDPD